MARVTDGSHYQLPKGLREGDTVKLISFDHGFWIVEKDGAQYQVFIIRVDSGWEYQLGGRWLPADDWRVKVLKEMREPLTEKAKACIEGAIVYPFT
jgi:hypothetical protein